MTASPETTHRLVVADDGTGPSDIAWDWLTAQPWPGWDIDVLTAAEDDIRWGEPSEPVEWTPTWKRTRQLSGSPTVRFMQVATDPRAMLAERSDADLMVVGLRSHSYLESLVTGSTTEWLLHHPPAPLLVAGTADKVADVLVCADGSDDAARAVEVFTSLPLAADTRVTVLAVDDGRADAATAAQAGLDAVADKVADAEAVVTAGPPTQTILDRLVATQPHLVVLGTRGLTGWKRLRLGSTAAAVVRVAPCSSLVACVPE